VLFNALHYKPNFESKLLNMNLDPCDCLKGSLLRALDDIYLKGRLKRAGFSKRSRFVDINWIHRLDTRPFLIFASSEQLFETGEDVQ
jgi:hypothetical protein